MLNDMDIFTYSCVAFLAINGEFMIIFDHKMVFYVFNVFKLY